MGVLVEFFVLRHHQNRTSQNRPRHRPGSLPHQARDNPIQAMFFFCFLCLQQYILWAIEKLNRKHKIAARAKWSFLSERRICVTSGWAVLDTLGSVIHWFIKNLIFKCVCLHICMYSSVTSLKWLESGGPIRLNLEPMMSAFLLAVVTSYTQLLHPYLSCPWSYIYLKNKTNMQQ